MVAPTKLIGANGVVSVNGITIAVADFTMSIKRGVASQSRVGKWSDRKLPGKADLTGSLTNIDVIGDHIARLLSSGAGVAPQTKTVLQNCDTIGDWTSSDPTNTPIAAEVTIKQEGTNSLKITPSGTQSQNDTITATISSKNLTGNQMICFWIRSNTIGAIIQIGMGASAWNEQLHVVTIQQANVWQQEYWDISGIADVSKNAITKLGFQILGTTANGAIYIDDINSFLGVRIGAGSVMTIYGDAVDAASNRVKCTAANCILTDGSMKFNDSNKVIDGPISFTMQDADADLTLTYT